ncbi:TniQ family protein [Bradyrhizobium diazoefficiens]
MSFVSRLGARHGVPMAKLCSDFGLSFRGVVNGDAGTLRRAARLAGADPDVLLDAAFVLSGSNLWSRRGTLLHRTVLRRERIAICPACALGDVAAEPKLRPIAAIYGRACWLLAPVRTCHLHRIPLTVVEKVDRPQRTHDFAWHSALLVPRLQEHVAAAVPRDPGALETYVLGRLEGKAVSPLLDPMPLASAVRLCETAGAVALSGPKVDIKALSADERLAAGGRGCEAITAGPEAFRALLADLMSQAAARRRMDGPSVAFGRLNDLLQLTGGEEAFDVPREILRDFVVANMPIAAGRKILGRVVGPRRLHTVHTLAQAHNVHRKTLRKHLKAAGLLADRHAAFSDHNVRIEAKAGSKIARQLEGTLSKAAAMEMINIPRAQMDVLVKAGLIIPQRSMDRFAAHDRYAIRDLERFMARLTARAVPAPAKDKRFRQIPTVAKICCCSAAEVVRLVLRGKVRTQINRYRYGYQGVHVELSGVRKAVRRPDTGGLSMRRAARAIGTSDLVLEALIAGGQVASFVGANPVNRCPQKLVARKEVARFKAKYVSLWRLSKQRRTHIATLKERLDRAGIKPAFDPDTVGARFYLLRQVKPRPRGR